MIRFIGAQRRVTALAAAVLVAASFTPTSVVGAAPNGAPPPSITVSATDGAYLTVTGPCDAPSEIIPSPGRLTVQRDSGVAGDVMVDVSYSGSLVGLTESPLPDPVVIPSGQESAEVEVVALRAGDLTLTVGPGSGYTGGDPSSATVTITAGPNVIGSCPAEISETIELGATPSPFPALRPNSSYDVDVEIDGELPPGVTLGFNGTFEGAATQTGTFTFVVRYRSFGLTLLEQSLEITVVAAGTGPATPEAPAVPTGPGQASGPGAAAPATSVDGRPTFTG